MYPKKPEQPQWFNYSPDWAPHVKGRYEERFVDQETSLPDPQHIEARCEHPDCAGKDTLWKGTCMSGSVRTWINKYALAHLHRDPLVKGYYHHPSK